ncbi:MAG: DNA-binding protein [Pseudomonadota bacterium]
MNTDEQFAEKTLLADIEQLRSQFPNTQELYREVCALMFFRYGVTPTANKLYQLVRKGSMSAPAEALNRFWAQLRERSRVTIEHPDLPEELKTAAGELAATLWKSAQQTSRQALAVFREQAREQVEQAQLAEAQAKTRRDALADALLNTQEALAASDRRISVLQQELAAAAATNAALESRLTEARDDASAQHERLDAARRDHAAELDKVRAQGRLAEERFEGMQKYALQEIDRERTATSKLQKTLDAERLAAAAAGEKQRIEYNAVQAGMADVRQQVGALEGTVEVLRHARDRALEELQAARIQLEGAIGQAASNHSRADRLQQELHDVLASLDERLAAARREGAGGRRVRRPVPKMPTG